MCQIPQGMEERIEATLAQLGKYLLEHVSDLEEWLCEIINFCKFREGLQGMFLMSQRSGHGANGLWNP